MGRAARGADARKPVPETCPYDVAKLAKFRITRDVSDRELDQ
jgi:hypothetical protein